MSEPAEFAQVEAITPSELDPRLVRFIEPIRDVVQRRFFSRRAKDRVITGSELVKLGLVTQSDIDALDN